MSFIYAKLNIKAIKFCAFFLKQDDDAEAILAADFEIGHFLRERIIPRSVLYFTGEAIEDDDDDVSLSPSVGSVGEGVMALMRGLMTAWNSVKQGRIIQN